MAWIYSTGAINFRTGAGSSRKIWKDCVLDIYSGTAPANADAAIAGTKLMRITVGSGAVVAGTSDYSTPEKFKVVFTDHDDTETYDLHLTIDSVLTSFNWTNGTSIGGHTLALIAAEFAKQINNSVLPIQAVSDGVDTVYVEGQIGGLTFTLVDGAAGTAAAPTITNPVDAARGVYTLQFGPPTAGVISKTADVWSGVGLVTGVAGYGRLVLPSDTAAATTTEIRAQGIVATSGTEITMSNTTITSGATSTIDGASITMPTGA